MSEGEDLRYPLTRSQRYYWLQYAALPWERRRLCVVRVVVPLPPGTVVAEATAALTELVARHHGLRSRVIVDGRGDLLQVVAARFPFEPQCHQHSPDAPADDVVDEMMATPIDAEQGPPIRAALLCQGHLAHTIVLVVLHMFLDGAGARLVTRELPQIVTNLQQKRDASAGLPVPVQNGEVAAREAEPASQRRADRALARWSGLLDSAPNVTFPYPASQDSTEPAYHAVRFTAGGFAPVLRQAAGRCGVSPDILLLSAFAFFVNRYTGQPTSSWQVTVDKGDRGASRYRLGPNVQKVFCVLTETGTDGVPEFLAQVEGAVLLARMHGDYDEFALREEVVRATLRRRAAIGFDGYFDCSLGSPDATNQGGSSTCAPASIEQVRDGHVRFLHYWPLAIKVAGGHSDVHIRLTASRRAIGPADAVRLLRGVESLVRACADDGPGASLDHACVGVPASWPRPSPWVFLPRRSIRVDTQATLRSVESHPAVASARIVIQRTDEREMVICSVRVRCPVTADELAEHQLSHVDTPGVVLPDVFDIEPAASPTVASGPAEPSPALEALCAAVLAANGLTSIDPTRGYVAGGGRLCRVPALLRILAGTGWSVPSWSVLASPRSLRQVAAELTPPARGAR